MEKADRTILTQIKEAVLQTMEHEGMPGCFELSLLLTDDGQVRDLNREYRNKDTTTDVLSFPNFTAGEIAQLKKLGRKAKNLFEAGSSHAYLGDIAISVPQAAKQALETGHSLAHEMILLTVHAALHLLGYDHAKTDEAMQMFGLQTSILKDLGVEWRCQV